MSILWCFSQRKHFYVKRPSNHIKICHLLFNLNWANKKLNSFKQSSLRKVTTEKLQRESDRFICTWRSPQLKKHGSESFCPIQVSNAAFKLLAQERKIFSYLPKNPVFVNIEIHSDFHGNIDTFTLENLFILFIREKLT